MTNWAGLCGECAGYKRYGELRCSDVTKAEGKPLLEEHNPCDHCQGTGYQHPWVAPLLAECRYCGTKDEATTGPREKGWVYRAWHDENGNLRHEKAYAHPVCQGTGKRYPQLWRQEESEGRGSGWIPEITEGALWMVGAIYGDEFTVSLCIEAGFTERGFYARPARDYEFVDAWLKRTEDQRIEALGKAIAAVGVVESPHG